MNTFLWIVQGFLALLFLYSGICKSTLSRERLVAIGQTGADGLSYPAIRTIGLLEIAGAAGIILPAALDILPVLTPLTALCFALIMMFAAPVHVRRREWGPVVLNIVVALMSLFVAWARYSARAA